MNDHMTTPETNGNDITPEDTASALPDAPGADAAPAPEKKERRAKAKAKKAPTATKAARGKKAKMPREEKEKAPRPEKRRIFVKSMLPPEKRERVDQRFERLHVLGRKSVENMLDMGEEFHGLSLDVEDPKDWEDLVKAETEYEVKTARNWKAIHAKMGHRRAEIIAHKVTPTILIKLLPAAEETIDTVIASFAEGKRLKVSEVRALVDSSKEAVEEGPHGSTMQGGLKGMRALGLSKLARQQKTVTAALKAIRQTFAAALEARKLEKGKLANEIMPIAKLANRELTEILCDIDQSSLVGGQALRHLKAEDETWAKVLCVLYAMAGADGWPDKGKLMVWLKDEVMPLLAFAIDGTDVAVRAEERVEVVAAPEEVDGVHGDDAIEPEAMSEAVVIAAVDAPTLPEVTLSVEAEAEAEPAEAVEVTVAPALDFVVAPKPKRFNLTLERSADKTANALAAEMAEQANRAAASAIGSNGPA